MSSLQRLLPGNFVSTLWVADAGEANGRRSAPQKVDTRSLQGTGAAARENKTTVGMAVDMAVHFVEELWNLLNLVDDNLLTRPRPLCLELLAQELGAGSVAPKFLGLEKVDPVAIRVHLPQERALAGLAGTPEEETLGSRLRKKEIPPEHTLEIIMITRSVDSNGLEQSSLFRTGQTQLVAYPTARLNSFWPAHRPPVRRCS